MERRLSSSLGTALLVLLALSAPAGAADKTKEGFVYTLYNDEATIAGYEGPGGDITIPATFSVSGGRLADVVCIMRAAFKGNRDLTSVTIESKLTSIESETFMGCTGLVSVDIW